MELQIAMTPAGLPALRYGPEWLDDETDPIAGAMSFVQEEDLSDTNRVVPNLTRGARSYLTFPTMYLLVCAHGS